MLAKRLVARLDIKAPNLVKGIRMEGLRVLGDPAEFARKYDAEGIDELLYVDIVASLYGRSGIVDLVTRTSADTYTPLTVAGGIRTMADVDAMLRAGADKVAINTAAVKWPEILTEVSKTYGSQAMVLSIEAKRTPKGWEAYTDCGREKTGLNVVEWARRGVDLGAGEVLLTAVDREGMRNGLDQELCGSVSEGLGVPVVLSGGAGTVDHLAAGYRAGASAVAVASCLHYGQETVGSLKAGLRARGVEVRC